VARSCGCLGEQEGKRRGQRKKPFRGKKDKNDRTSQVGPAKKDMTNKGQPGPFKGLGEKRKGEKGSTRRIQEKGKRVSIYLLRPGSLLPPLQWDKSANKGRLLGKTRQEMKIYKHGGRWVNRVPRKTTRGQPDK